MHKKVIRGTAYYYTSVRENGKIKTVYLGRTEKEAEEKEKRLARAKSPSGHSLLKDLSKVRLLVFFSMVIFIAAGFFFLRGYYVGYVSVSGPEIYSAGDKLTGTINITFSSGELYPEDSVVDVSLGGQDVQMGLSILLSENATGIGYGTGDYYVSGSSVSGNGGGYGVAGERTVYPELEFSCILACTSGGEIVEQNLPGACSAAKPYVMQIPAGMEGCSVSVESVMLRNATADPGLVQASVEGNSIVVTTDYSEMERGVGKGFEGGGDMEVQVDLSKFGMTVPEQAGEFAIRVRLVYNQSVLEEAEKNISVSLPLIEAGAQIPCEDNDKDGYETCSQPVDCDDIDPAINPGAKEICGNMADENCDGFMEPCTKLSDVISAKGLKFVNSEVENEIARRGQLRVIIKFRDAAARSEVEKEITPNKKFKSMFSAVVDEREMVRLASKFGQGEIELIQADHPIKLTSDYAANLTGVNLAWDLNITGKGQTVCVIDSGIDYNHPSLSSAYAGGYDFVNNDYDPMDDNGHGTYVSGIVSQIAPDSKILAAKAFNSIGVGYESDIIAAID